MKLKENKVFETIHERIINSKMTIETDQDNDMNQFEFISKIKGKDNIIKISNKQTAKLNVEIHDDAFEEKLDGKYEEDEEQDEGIGSSNLYGVNVSRHVRQISWLMNENEDENKGTEKNEYENTIVVYK